MRGRKRPIRRDAANSVTISSPKRGRALFLGVDRHAAILQADDSPAATGDSPNTTPDGFSNPNLFQPYGCPRNASNTMN